MANTLDRTLEALAALPEGGERYFFELALLHEDMHGEAFLMTLQTLGLPAPDLPDLEPARARLPKRDVAFGGGRFAMGTRPGCGRFVFDNEKWEHEVELAPFAMCSRVVTQGEYAEFARDRGAGIPAHWSREGGEWLVRRFDRWRRSIPDAPMMLGVARGCRCRIAAGPGRRLPDRRPEWEFAALADDPGGRGTDRGRVGMDCERVRSVSGFQRRSVQGLSEPWFGTHRVMRGGSFFTRPRLVHARFRQLLPSGARRRVRGIAHVRVVSRSNVR
jgi:iron(II)-dependent oxidoreductase